jgi:thiosulfate dehydrogenase [quinone] large subunit
MLVAFFESVKHVGHLLPLSFLRVFLGYYYLQSALEKFSGDFLHRPKLAAQVAEALPTFAGPTWYKHFLEMYFVPHWQTTAFIITGLEFAIAFSYLFGFVTRPMAIVAMLLAANMMMLTAGGSDFYKTLIAVHLVMAWIGAGRCLGFDYYFFKRQRGLWW